MKDFILHLLVSSLAIFLTAYILPGVNVGAYSIAILVALVLAVLNAIVKPLLIILTIPITIFTFGLFLLAINAGIILIADWLVDGFHVDSFWWALLFSIVVSFIMSVFQKLGSKD